jgi:cell division transport system ATP-binding protein
MIDFKNVTKVYEPNITALKNVTVHVDKGEFVFVLGHSGAGKSTFLKLMLREEKATEGEIVINGYDLSKIKEKDVPYMRRTLGVVFQDFRLIPELTASENVAFAMRVTNIDEKEIEKRVPYILSLVGLANKADMLPAQLSGGEQQRVALARALVHNPDLVIADEPTGNIDPQLSIEIMELLKAINSIGTTVLVVTHEHELARAYARRIIEMRAGVIVNDYVNDPGKAVKR